MKWIFKWLFRLFLLAVVLIVILLLSLQFDSPGSGSNIASAPRPAWTPRLEDFRSGLTEPTVTIQNLKLYNPPSFGGTPFLDIPEIHVEYDRAALGEDMRFTSRSCASTLVNSTS